VAPPVLDVEMGIRVVLGLLYRGKGGH